MSMRQYSIAKSGLLFDTTQEFTATLRTDPVRTTPKVIGRNFAPPRNSFLASTSDGPIRIIASPQSSDGLLPGQKIRFAGRAIESSEKRVVALVIATGKIEIVTAPSRWAASLAAIRTGLRSASGDGDAGALIPGMVIGDTSKQSVDFKGDMRRSGLSHLVAVSGANFAIVSAFVLWCAQFVFRRITPRLILTAIVLASFIALVRPSPSVLRAAAMAAVMLLAMKQGQARDSLPALGFAIAAVVFIDPWQSRDPGFALSVLATAGLLILAPRVVGYLQRWIPEKLAQVLAIPVAALAFCLPVIVALSGYISPFSIIANIAAAPLVVPITIVGFVAALISPLSPPAAEFLIFFIRPFAHAISAIARWGSQFPVITTPKGYAGFALLATLLILIFIFRKKILIPLFVLSFALIWLGRFPAGDWDLFICDVGQGDAAVISLPDNRAIVIDVGPSPELIDKCLRNLRVKRISLLILTHPHADHVAGLSGATKNRIVDATWYGNIAAGSKAVIGEYSIEVLWPLAVGATDENPNNISIAAMIRSTDLTLFAAGDIEPPVQEQLRGQVGKVDVYKVAHHGSRFQDIQLMQEIDATLAVISAGEGNTYGHPAPQTLQSLQGLGAHILRTDIDGAIAVKAQRHRITFDTQGSKLAFLGIE
jgi:competence protein ComEC